MLTFVDNWGHACDWKVGEPIPKLWQRQALAGETKVTEVSADEEELRVIEEHFPQFKGSEWSGARYFTGEDAQFIYNNLQSSWRPGAKSKE